MPVTLNLTIRQVYIIMKCLREHCEILYLLPYENYDEEIKEINNILDQFPMGVWNYDGETRADS